MILKIFTENAFGIKTFWTENTDVETIEHIYLDDKEVRKDDKQSLLEIIDILKECKDSIINVLTDNILVSMFASTDEIKDFVESATSNIINKINLMVDELNKKNEPEAPKRPLVERLAEEYVENELSTEFVFGTNNIKKLLVDYSKWILAK